MVEDAEKSIVKLWRAYRTAKEMVSDRGYELGKEETQISLDDFRTRFCEKGLPDRNLMSFSARPSTEMLEKYTPMPTQSNPEPQPQVGEIWVEFSGSSSMGISEFRKFIQTVDSRQFMTGILITSSSLTSAALKLIPSVLPRIIEVFHEQDLLVNITKHELVPKHVVLSYADKAALLQRYRVKETQLPRIQMGDPVARYYGLRRGQVFKIIRRSETAGRYASYRWCL